MIRRGLMGAVLFAGLAAFAEERPVADGSSQAPSGEVLNVDCTLEVFERLTTMGESEGTQWEKVHTVAGSSGEVQSPSSGTQPAFFQLSAGEYEARVVVFDPARFPDARTLSVTIKNRSAPAVETLSLTDLPAKRLIAQSTYENQLAQVDCKVRIRPESK